MKGNQLLRKEFTEIIKNKKILIPIIAVLFVPILYAGMFLWAFWDPYKQLDDLPVAVVNLDKGAVFDGKPIEVGKGLVDNLKDNKSFKWEFVSEKEAKKGMEGRKYYMLVRIPDDFSSNATTLLKDNPKPLNLEYIPNESLNFLSSQIGGTAIEKIKGEVASTLTKTYAEKMFDSIQDVSKGLADGAEGANKLHDGSSELHDGSSKVTDGLHTLQGKSGEMKDGAQKLADGSNKLVDGSGKVTNGLNTLNSKTGEMQIGIGKLVDGSGKVTNGLNTLNSKTGEMQTGIGKLIDGSGKVTDGLNTLNSKTGEMQKGIGELHDGSEKVTGGLNKLVSKSGELKTGTTDLSNGMGKLVEGQSQLEEGSQAIQKGLQDLNSNVQKSAADLEEMQSKVPSILNTVNEKIDGAGANVNQLNELTQSTAGDAKTATQDVANLQKQIESLPKEYQEQLQPFITSAVKSTATVQQKAAGVAGGTNKLNEEVKQLKGEINQKTSDAQNKLPNTAKLDSLTEGIEKLASAQKGFVENFQGFGKNLNVAKEGANKFKNESGQLIDAINQLADGSGKVTGGLGALSAGANQMAGGVHQLADGSSQVTGGLGQLSAGANQMAGGVNQLADGSSKVTGGLGTLSVGANQMAGGVNHLADGSGQVTTGLGTLNGGLNQMSNGSTQLIDGVNKLADGSGKVTDGLVKVNDGSGELAEKLGEGAEKTGEVKGTDKTYDMFASPVKVKTEKIAEVPNYGTGFTPYFLSLGLFVGALLLSIVYPLRDTVGVPKSGFSWFISKFGVLLSVGIIQAIVADVILLFGLGVEVQSIPYFILFSIVTSLAFIALIQCLVTAFGDAGRFIAIITLIMQLTTSAGTFPLELIPKFLQPFNAWLPMTYSVSGLKAVVSSGDFDFMWQNIGMLMIFIVVLSLGTIASLTLMHKRQFKNVAENQSVEA
ncbi:YhgE/Pip domain-containing protein [Bacillus thuringiensis]|uniref:YhgE/Pip domain-containing protein n=1 Tax=Bacillus thuringiensis TaxID=1428 RepID=UPI000BF271A7|nr:YhgE/Pip domain-containing protein [Bacillus thuringiensis]MCC6080461.1 YhgE/Pip domain-containing protein [Bacillus thuringiensis]MED1901818.1 YhgE/Pip domain-containing protein [Bacillus thuringiensis]PFN31960.1 phage infection protein [Bacillus thuringiensis]PGV86801.1 phage infection protein [Bacillus thuringiensis]HDX9702663.1 YhgE/Pip domain-containing protein [Bacillus thuringiensis]